MKLQEFIEYKRIILYSEETELNEQAIEVLDWLDEHDRLDEGMFGNIWKWIKKNFSPTARKIYSLADEYENELLAELRAEWSKLASKDLASKYRSGSYMRLSRDYENQMDDVAGDDPTYKELARTLINKKNIKVKKVLLSELRGKLDPEDVTDIKNNLESDEKDVLIKEAKLRKKLNTISPLKIKNITPFLNQNMNSQVFRKLSLTNTEKDKLITSVILYVDQLSKYDKNIKLDQKTCLENLKNGAESILSNVGKLSNISDKITEKDVMDIQKTTFIELMQDEKPPRMEDLKERLFKISKEKIEKRLKDEESEDGKETTISPDTLEPGIVTKHTEEISDVDVDKSIEIAKKETGENNPSPEEVSEEIKQTVKEWFDNSLDELLKKLKTQVEEFNSKPESERIDIADSLNYRLDNTKLNEPSEDDLKLLLDDFVQIAGLIVPYGIHKNKKLKQIAFSGIAKRLINIYAIQKDINKKLSKKDIEKIVDSIKQLS